MLNLPPALIRAANRMDQTSPWLILLDIVLPNVTLYLVNNTEDIVFGGQTYNAFPFQYERPKESSKGDIPNIQVSVSNVTRVVQSYIEPYNGGVGCDVVMRLVNAAYLTEDYASLTIPLVVLGAKCTPLWVVFTLGCFNPINRRYPVGQYIAKHCRFRFRGPHCGYVGAQLSCDHTLDRCRALKNSARFGGHPGLDGRGIRLI